MFYIRIIFIFLFLSGCGSSKTTSTTQKLSKQTEQPQQEVIVPKPASSEVKANSSRKLKDIESEGKPLEPYQCEDKFKNKNGVCEVPNPPYPRKKDKNKNHF